MLHLTAASAGALTHHLAAINRILRSAKSGDVDSGLSPSGGSLRCKYSLDLLGTKIHEQNLPGVVRSVIEMLECFAPDALESLSAKKARVRNHISRDRSEIHPGRPDLATARTPGGWYYSCNIGMADAQRWLKALCSATDLKYGVDIGPIEHRKSSAPSLR